MDQLSGGRFVFGIGVGWFEEEFEVLGQDFHNRGARTDEAMDLMKALWSDDPVSFEGRHYSVDRAYFSPKPLQKPSPPIWVAGGSKVALKRAARIAANYGARVMVAEEYRMGGTCVIRGCVPKKLFVIGSHVHQEIEDAAGFGWSIGQVSFDWATLVANKHDEEAVRKVVEILKERDWSDYL